MLKNNIEQLKNSLNPNNGNHNIIINKLAQMKVLKGDKGDMPVKGKDYFTESDINDVVSRVRSVVKDGISIRGDKGLSGIDGKDGYTPVRGKDYWTANDRTNIILDALKHIKQPKDGVSPNIDEIVSRVTDNLKKNPIEFKDIRGTEGLVNFLKMGGFRGGGGNSGGTGITSISVATANGLSGVSSGGTTPILTLNISALDASKIANGSVSNTEFQFLDGVTSSIQTQLNSKGTGTVTGSGAANQLTYWTSSSAISGNSNILYNPGTGVMRLGINEFHISSISGGDDLLILNPSIGFYFGDIFGDFNGNYLGMSAITNTIQFGLLNGSGTQMVVASSTGVLSRQAIPTGTGDFVGPGSATDNAVVRFDGTSGKLGQNSLVTVDDNGRLTVPTGTTTGGIKLGNNNTLTELTSLEFIDWQRTGTDYTLMRIKAPTGTNNTHEATMSLLIDRDGNNAGINEEFIDFYNEHYSDSVRGGIRSVKTGTGSLKPFVIGHWSSSGPKDDGDGLIVWAYDAVAIQNSLNVGQTITDSTVVYSRFGKANTTSHSLSTNSDVLVSGMFEVDGAAFCDSTLTIATNAAIGTSISSGNALLIDGSGYANNLFAATGSVSPAANTNGTLFRVAGTLVEASSGTHTLLAGYFLGATTVTSGAATVTNTASMYIENSMTATVSGKNYTIWSDDGINRFDGIFNAGGTDLTANQFWAANSSGTAMVGVSGAIIAGKDRATGQTGAKSLATFTVGGSDSSYLISANILVTTATLHSFTCTCSYTDESNTSRVVTLNFSTLAGALTPTIANAGGAAPYEGVPLHIRCKAGTTIILATTGTFTTVTYNFEEMITQIA